jgi:CRP-like cAMP-binding protein
VRAKSPCRVLEIPRSDFEEVLAADSGIALEILRGVASAVAARVEQTRQRLIATGANLPRASLTSGRVWEFFHPDAEQYRESASRLHVLEDSVFFEDFDAEHLAILADHAAVVSVPAESAILEEGRAADHMYVLAGGAVRLTTNVHADGEPSEVPVQLVSQPGEVFGWSAMIDPRRYLATAVAQVDSVMFSLAAVDFDRFAAEDPQLGVAMIRKILWLLGNRLRALRTRLVAHRYDEELIAVKALLDQSAESLPVSSALHKVPLYLANRLTLDDAIHSVELVRAHGDENERHVAGLCLEILENVRREVRFYRGLQSIYEHVANAAPEIGANALRIRTCREFETLFEDVDYVIDGEDNLPEHPGFIVVMNHLRSHPDNALPNDFHLILDTHFVSSLVLHRKYGEPPMRVVRRAFPSEFMQNNYYDRLEFIYVDVKGTTREYPLAAKGGRQNGFIETAESCLRQRQNIVICPEGDCTITEFSPMPFRTGAFRLAATVKPEPLIVPIALANFDKKVTRTRVAAVIREPVRLSEHMSDPNDKEAMRGFVEAYRERFAGYVREAVELAAG